MKSLIPFIGICGIFLLSGCGSASKHDHAGGGSPVFYGLAVMKPTKGSRTSGTVWFAEGFGKVTVEAEISGLDPNSKHGFHIHEFGDCSAADATSAGGHYNPEGSIHGGMDSEKHHAGDLGNLEADKRGRAHLKMEVPSLSVAGDINPIIGRAVIIHKNADDLISQPTGGAGGRIACGVIGAATK